MDESFKVTDYIEKNKWSEFIRNHPKGSTFQTPEMLEVYKRTKWYEPIFLAVVDETDNIKAMLLGHVIREFEGFLGQFSTRSIIVGGPLDEENEEGLIALKVLMKHYDKIARKKALYTEIRNRCDSSSISNVFNDMGYMYVEELNFLIDLSKSKEEIWKQIHRSMRKNINKAQRNDVIIEDMNDKLHIQTFYDILKDVYHHAKMPLADISLFEAIYDILVPKGMAKFHLAKHNGEYIGGRLSFIYRKTIYANFVGVLRRYKKLNANPLLNWHVMMWGSENGYCVFDFGGAGNPINKEHEGIREFKKQFGGQLVNFGRYKKIHSPRKLWLAEKGFEIWRRLRR